MSSMSTIHLLLCGCCCCDPHREISPRNDRVRENLPVKSTSHPCHGKGLRSWSCWATRAENLQSSGGAGGGHHRWSSHTHSRLDHDYGRTRVKARAGEAVGQLSRDPRMHGEDGCCIRFHILDRRLRAPHAVIEETSAQSVRLSAGRCRLVRRNPLSISGASDKCECEKESENKSGGREREIRDVGSKRTICVENLVHGERPLHRAFLEELHLVEPTEHQLPITTTSNPQDRTGSSLC